MRKHQAPKLPSLVRPHTCALWPLSVCVALAGIIVLPGCASQLIRNDPSGPALLPGWKRIGHAAANAVKDPRTWAPAVAGAVVYASGRDEGISDWATAHTPIFGSMAGAARASDILRGASAGACALSATARLALVNRSDLLYAAPAELLAAVAGVGATQGATELLKNGVGRLRPDGSDRLSFPSGHASTSSIYTTLAEENLEAIPMPAPLQIGLQSGLELLALGTGWARVEAGRHYLSDVLVGAALGHFLGEFVSDAFLGEKTPVGLSFDFSTPRGDPGFGVHVSLPVSKLRERRNEGPAFAGQ